jgi:membrane protease YdiL (CAAX protease family)
VNVVTIAGVFGVSFTLVAALVFALIFLLVPLFAFGFAGPWCVRRANSLSRGARLALPALLAVPYCAVALTAGTLAIRWLAIYLAVPVLVAVLLDAARRIDPGQKGHWLDFLVLLPLGLAVDLRWLETAWPHRTALLGKLVLLDAGLYGFLAVRQLTGVGFDLHLRGRDWKIGLREFAFCAPLAIALGLALGFLHWHGALAHPVWWMAPAWVFTFVGVALPEEIFFRGWMQNLLERRMGRWAALLVTTCLFGLSHFNKRSDHFNWRYVLVAALAGIFYGRAWRADRRVGASAITHATVDTLWGALLR